MITILHLCMAGTCVYVTISVYIFFEKNSLLAVCLNGHNIKPTFCGTSQKCDITMRQMCRQDTKAVPTALTGALESKGVMINAM